MSDIKSDVEPVDAEMQALEEDAKRDPDSPGSAEAEVAEVETVAERTRKSADEWGDILVSLIAPAFAVLAPNWDVQKSEVKMLADSYAPLLAKYFPDVSDVGPEIGAAVCTIAVIGPRLAIPRKRVEESEEGPDKKAKAKPVSQGLLSEDDR